MEKIKISYDTREENITSLLVKIVTTVGRPFILLDSEGFRDIINPIYNALHMSPITSRNIMDNVRAKEIAINQEINSQLLGNNTSKPSNKNKDVL